MAARVGTVAAVAVALLGTYVGPSVYRGLNVAGVFRTPTKSHSDADVFVIEDTLICEDIHHHVPSNRLFAACDDSENRWSWFPPMANFDDPLMAAATKGSIHVIDPDTKKSQRLKFENFDSTFITHGIDVITDPENEKGVYIFAVNHPPNPVYLQQFKEKKASAADALPKARSQIELFYHVLGSPTIRHVRSILHPLIQTPNDIFAVSPNSFLVTNDHYYRDGRLRILEDVYSGAGWTTTVHVCEGFTAAVALKGLHNNNGLSHGRSPDEVLIGSAASGNLHIARISGSKEALMLNVTETVHIKSAIDNPSYYLDPFAGRTGRDDSGIVLGGLSKAAELLGGSRDPSRKRPVIAWLVKSKPGPEVVAVGNTPAAPWQQDVIFEDDGSTLDSASAAVLVGIDPRFEGGKKKAWLYITGFLSRNMIAVKVDL